MTYLTARWSPIGARQCGRSAYERQVARKGSAMAYDKENPEWTEADFAKAKGPEVLPPKLQAAFPKTKARRGRPAGSNKERVTMRLDRDVVAKFKATGRGWQSRINEALKRAKL